MKKTQCLSLLLSIIWYSLATQAQTIVYYPTVMKNKEPLLYGGVTAQRPNGDWTFRLSVSTADDSTTYYYPVNRLSRQVNIAYFLNTRSINISLYLKQQINIEDIRFRVFEKDSSETASWQPAKGRVVRQNERDGSYQTNIFLPPIDCNNKVLYLQAYHINDPESLLTQIVSTKLITRPSVAAFYHFYRPSKKKMHQQDSSAYTDVKPLVSKALKTVDLNEQQEIRSGQLLLATDNEPALYHAFIIRNYQGVDDSIALNRQWEQINTSNSRPDSLLKDLPLQVGSSIYTIAIPQEYISRPGAYRVAVIPGFLQPGSSTRFAHAFPDQSVTLNYTVLRTRTWRDWLMIVLSAVGLLAIPIIIVILYRKRRQKTQLLYQEQSAKESRLKLDFVRAQLNPHFIYNALSGIQNLLQKNNMQAADKYLAKFSRLSRKILNDSERELISLEDELQLLDDYLQMEQMRFGFHYNFQTGENIDPINTEIPAMLVQPFVENAVKHGVSAVADGHITIQFEKSGSNILISICDNGKGYTPGISTGKGSTLSQNRISLLNDIYKTTPIHLSVTTNKKGTLVQITLKDWLA
ncbi:sensor histidine kinase [Niabella sp. CJ426]|uniref:sensor histidine kinase n=1 Tax=unclassified Niabella TaxID=2646634 RepID=UPI003CFFA9B5